jgi:hypothetical protein
MSPKITRRRGAGRRRPVSVLAGCLLTAGLLAGALAGCAASPPDLSSDAAKQLQSQVLAVTEAAAADDSAGALKLLDELVTKLNEAAARGEVSFKRHQSIRGSLEAVRADLTAKQAAVEAARVAAEQEAARVAAEQEAAAQAAAAQAAAQAAEEAAARAAAEAAVVPAPAVVAPPTDSYRDKRKNKDKDDD